MADRASAKLTVTVHTVDDPPLTVEAVAPFIRHLVTCLGADRLMFGSNWPVSTAVVAYRAWVEILHELVADDERVWSPTARRGPTQARESSPFEASLPGIFAVGDYARSR